MNTMNPRRARPPKKLWHTSVRQCISSNVLIRLALAALLVTAGTACKHNKRANTTVARRAGFDLSCPNELLKLNVVDTEGARKIINGIVTPLSADYEVPPPIAKGRGKRGDKQMQKAEKRGKMDAAESAPVEKEKRRKRKDKKGAKGESSPPVEPAAPAPAGDLPDPT